MSDKIVELRLKRGLSQAALADILHVDQATVSRWERRQQLPTRTVQLQLLAMFDAAAETERRRLELDFVRHSPFPMAAFDRTGAIHAMSPVFPGSTRPPPLPRSPKEISPAIQTPAIQPPSDQTPGALLGAADLKAAIAAAEDEHFFDGSARAARVIARIYELDGEFDYADQIWTPFQQRKGAPLIVAQLVFVELGEFRKRRDRFGLFRLLD